MPNQRIESCIDSKRICAILYTDRQSVRGDRVARNKYPEETVRLILDVATRLFAEKVMTGRLYRTSLMKLSFPKAPIYHHFASKEDILEAIFRPYRRRKYSSFGKSKR